MNVSRPADALGAGPEADVLATLAGTTRPMSGREVARLTAGVSDRNVQLVLGRLAKQGLVNGQDVPPARLYTLNRRHIAFPAVEAVIDLRAELLRRLREAFAPWESPPEHASLFGSAARGDGNVDSDIDILLVRPERVTPLWHDRRRALEEDVVAWTGNDAQVIDRRSDELLRLADSRRPIIQSVIADGIVLVGPPLHQLLAELRAPAEASR